MQIFMQFQLGQCQKQQMNDRSDESFYRGKHKDFTIQHI